MAPMRGMAPMAAAKPAAARIRAEQRPPAHVNVAGFWPRLGVAGAVEAAALAMVVLAVAGWRRYVRWIDRMA
jgi:hypothetical protein